MGPLSCVPLFVHVCLGSGGKQGSSNKGTSSALAALMNKAADGKKSGLSTLVSERLMDCLVSRSFSQKVILYFISGSSLLSALKKF